MPLTVSNLSSLLSPYLATGAQSAATTVAGMLNACGPKLQSLGDWKDLRHPVTYNVASGRFSLPMSEECALTVSLNGVPIDIMDMSVTTQYGMPGEIIRPCGWDTGIIDNGWKPLMEEPPEDGIEYLEFTSATNTAFASGDIVTVTYEDTDDGYTQVALPLNTISTAITAAVTHASGAETNLTVTSSAGYVVGAGVTISGGSNPAYDGDWRVTAVPDGTHVVINKTFAAGAITGTIATNRTLQPANAIASVESMVYASLPSIVNVTSGTGDDEVFYGIIPAGDGVASFRRYEVPQVPEDPQNPDDWNVVAILKRAYVPVTSNSDIVYLSNIPAWTAAFLAVVARDASDYDREAAMWNEAQKCLDQELRNTHGGTKKLPIINPFGHGMPGLSNLTYGGNW